MKTFLLIILSFSNLHFNSVTPVNPEQYYQFSEEKLNIESLPYIQNDQKNSIQNEPETPSFIYFYDENGIYWKTDGQNYYYYKNGKWHKSNNGHQPPVNQETPIENSTILLFVFLVPYLIYKTRKQTELSAILQKTD